MPAATDHFRQIRKMPELSSLSDLIGFLRDELNWPLPDGAMVDDVTFDWGREELQLSDDAGKR